MYHLKNDVKTVFIIIMLIVASFPLQSVYAKLVDPPTVISERYLISKMEAIALNESIEINDIDISTNYILVSVGDTIHLLDNNGKEVWTYTPILTKKVYAIAIAPSEEYIVADVRNDYGSGQIYMIRIDKTPISSPIYYEGSKIDYFDLEKPKFDLDFVYKYGEKGYFIAIRKSQANNELAYVHRTHIDQDEIIWTTGLSNKQFPPTVTSNYDLYKNTHNAGTEGGNILIGDHLSSALYNNSFIRSTKLDKNYYLTLINLEDKNDNILWQSKKNKIIKNLGFTNKGSRIIASYGATLLIFNNPLITEQIPEKKPEKQKVVILANSIDYELASNFIEFLRNNNMEVIHATISDFEPYITEKFIIILGGPDAPEEIGNMVQTVLSKSQQDSIREHGARKKYVITNPWNMRIGQKVIVIAGSNRNETKNSEDQNKDSITTEVQSNN